MLVLYLEDGFLSRKADVCNANDVPSKYPLLFTRVLYISWIPNHLLPFKREPNNKQNIDVSTRLGCPYLINESKDLSVSSNHFLKETKRLYRLITLPSMVH